MAKKLFAVTNVKHDDNWFDADSPIDETLFTKEQLTALLDNGAVEIRDVKDEPKAEEKPATPTKATPPSQNK